MIVYITSDELLLNMTVQTYISDLQCLVWFGWRKLTMKSITAWSLVVGSILLCLSAKSAITERGGEVRSDRVQPDLIRDSLENQVAPPGIRAKLQKGQRAAIRVRGTAFNGGNLNGVYRECGRLNSARLYRLGSTENYCGWSSLNRRWVIGFKETGISSSTGIYYSIARDSDSVAVIGWKATRVWPGSAPAPTVSVEAENIPRMKSARPGTP